MKTLNDIRSEFINFFKRNNHTHVESSPLVPLNDPTLMFTNSGMVQFKDVFTGQKNIEYKRAVSSQKCVRAGGKHNDLENVGYTGRHLTFFEMLGNFSFGDYFKPEAIAYAWEFITKNLCLPASKLYITVYHEDEEAFKIWKKITGFSDNKIIRIKTEDNFWAMGNTGPCGPCSEIFYDHGEKIAGGLPGTKNEDGDRYVEIWNLVFMQLERLVDGTLVSLPNKSIDTGMGLERIAAVAQGVHDNYHTDLFKDLINASIELTSKKVEGKYKFSHRIIADHLRSTAFLIADGVMPSNEGRGYVLRRIIRRAVRHIHNLGYQGLMLPKLLPALISQMSEAYPQLITAEGLIKDVLGQEERNFRATLERGLTLLENEIDRLGSRKVLPGSSAFKLHDTYGFPLDLTQDILREKKLSVDIDGFNVEMAQQKEMARKAWVGSGESSVNKIWFEIHDTKAPTEFIGYNNLTGQGQVLALIQNSKIVDYVNNKDEFYLVTNQTPFYGESGGQLGDVGRIHLENTEIKVLDTKKPIPALHAHKCILSRGLVKIGDVVHMEVDEECRNSLKANHTATHLLHAALRSKLGNHVVQKGSLVAGDRLRFDFSNNAAVPRNILEEIELEINQLIAKNLSVQVKLQPYNEALKSGAIGLFGEKYDDEVRVVSIGEKKSYNSYSMELCGGTHVNSLAEICSFQIISESAIASGIRRIEAVTGLEALKRASKYIKLSYSLAENLKCDTEELPSRVRELAYSKKQLEKELAKFKTAHAKETLFSKENLFQYKDLQYVIGFLEGLSNKELRELAVANLNTVEKSAICLISTDKKNGVVSYVVSVSSAAISVVKAHDIVQVIADYLGSKGGGNAEFAQGGGKLPSNYNESKLRQIIRDRIISE